MISDLLLQDLGLWETTVSLSIPYKNCASLEVGVIIALCLSKLVELFMSASQ
jgi:hypothetical protein